MLSRLCESFGCLPSQAEAELETHPELVSDVLLVRAYIDVKRKIDTAKTEADVPKSPLVEVWGEIQVELMKERAAPSE
jgi:hypothetical protein